MKNWQKAIFVLLGLAFLGVSATAFLFWQKIEQFEPNVYYYVPPERSFIYTDEELTKYGVEDYIREAVKTEKAELIKEKNSFIYLNLSEMQLALYKEGERFEVFPIQAKGADAFWGKTPPGAYYAGYMSTLHWSTAANVWMPYAVQFYGNYYIHGWPYNIYNRPLPPGEVSGGCLRLLTRDAAVVFEFAERGMPILIFDEQVKPPLPALMPVDKEILPPEMKSRAFLAADLETGEIVLNREMDSEIYAGPAVKLMLALTASDNVNLGRRITARAWMFEEVNEGIIVPGKSYSGHDLLSPLLLHSSKEAALVLSRFLTPDRFVVLMNAKADGIGMNNSNFADVTGESQENIITLYDAARMAHYIKNYRAFIFNTSKEWKSRETIFRVLEMKSPDNVSRFVFVGVADSPDAESDIKNILFWLNDNFNLQ